MENARFRRQVSIGGYVVDFYCARLRLAIEIDGSIHALPDVQKFDILRENTIKELGVTIMRFSNDEVFNNLETILSSIGKVIIDLQEK